MDSKTQFNKIISEVERKRTLLFIVKFLKKSFGKYYRVHIYNSRPHNNSIEEQIKKYYIEFAEKYNLFPETIPLIKELGIQILWENNDICDAYERFPHIKRMRENGRKVKGLKELCEGKLVEYHSNSF